MKCISALLVQCCLFQPFGSMLITSSHPPNVMSAQQLSIVYLRWESQSFSSWEWYSYVALASTFSCRLSWLSPFGQVLFTKESGFLVLRTSRTVARKSSTGGLYVCAWGLYIRARGYWHSNLTKIPLILVFHVAVWGGLDLCLGELSPPQIPPPSGLRTSHHITHLLIYVWDQKTVFRYSRFCSWVCFLAASRTMFTSLSLLDLPKASDGLASNV